MCVCGGGGTIFVTFFVHLLFVAQPHHAIWAQASRDILEVGDVWALDLSPLEMQNAETKRVASSSGARRLEMSGPSMAIVPMRAGQFGPERLVATKGYSTTMAVSTLKHLIISQKLRRGDGPDGVLMPDSRRAERLFGDLGRTQLQVISHQD